MIRRTLFSDLQARLGQGKALLVLGPRQVGKTTLISHVISAMGNTPGVKLEGDDPVMRALLSGAGIARLESIVGTARWVFIDEAQRIPEVGLIAKMLVDQMPHVQVFISGSSALEINNSLQEPLTGRKFEFFLYPISWEEYEAHVGFLAAETSLEERLVLGMYPDVITRKEDAREVLRQLTASFLYRDVLAITGIKKPELLERLLQALALQIGNEVSYTELAQLLGIDKATVARYIDLLEKSFLVFRLTSFSRNERNEIKHNRKIYFYDNGLRNALINNLNPWELRSDIGALWENFLVAERRKQNAYHRREVRSYFWRTTAQQKIDYVEERSGALQAFEFKWKRLPKHRFPKSFLANYGASGTFVDRANFREFVTPAPPVQP
jgi:predicted AAA+ superfamily ATPase